MLPLMFRSFKIKNPGPEKHVHVSVYVRPSHAITYIISVYYMLLCVATVLFFCPTFHLWSFGRHKVSHTIHTSGISDLNGFISRLLNQNICFGWVPTQLLYSPSPHRWCTLGGNLYLIVVNRRYFSITRKFFLPQNWEIGKNGSLLSLLYKKKEQN